MTSHAKVILFFASNYEYKLLRSPAGPSRPKKKVYRALVDTHGHVRWRGSISHTSLHKGHPTRLTTLMTAPCSRHNSAALMSWPVLSSFLRTANWSLLKSYGCCRGEYQGELASTMAAPMVTAAVFSTNGNRDQRKVLIIKSSSQPSRELYYERTNAG